MKMDEMIFFHRARRNQLLEETDKYLLADYPITEENLEKIKIYRKALRDFMEVPEFINPSDFSLIPFPAFPF
jgi:hypothetical protein